MRAGLLAAAVVAGLAGCVSPEEQMARDTEASKVQCAAYGLQPGTRDFAQCLMINNNTLHQRREARSDHLIRLGAQLQEADAAAMRSMQSTTCRPLGNTVHCTTF